MKFVGKSNYIDNLSDEMKVSPALMIFLWLLALIANIGLFSGWIDGIFTIIFIINLFLSIKKYRKKY